MMWLAEMQQPDHRTTNEFRGLKKVRTEFGLVAMAHNLRELAGHRLANSLQSADFTLLS